MLPFLRSEDIVVPYVTSAGLCVQFGAVYLMEHSYPCAVTLSEELSVLNASHVQRINQWILALSLFCQRMAQLLGRCKKKRTAGLLTVDDEALLVLEIHPGRILKPVVSEPQFATSVAAYLLHIFYKLWHHSDARPYVQFPSGVLAYPNVALAAMTAFTGFIRGKFCEIAVRGGKEKDYYADLVIREPGHPIFVFPDLEQADGPWQKGESLTDHVDNCQLIRRFLRALKAALQAIANAGVVHIDLRLPNIFYRVISQKKGSGDEEETAADEEDVVEIRIIDWDDSLLSGAVIDATLYATMQHDARYPHGEEYRKATPAYHDGFYRIIKNELRNPNKKKAKAWSDGASWLEAVCIYRETCACIMLNRYNNNNWCRHFNSSLELHCPDKHSGWIIVYMLLNYCSYMLPISTYTAHCCIAPSHRLHNNNSVCVCICMYVICMCVCICMMDQLVRA